MSSQENGRRLNPNHIQTSSIDKASEKPLYQSAELVSPERETSGLDQREMDTSSLDQVSREPVHKPIEPISEDRDHLLEILTDQLKILEYPFAIMRDAYADLEKSGPLNERQAEELEVAKTQLEVITAVVQRIADLSQLKSEKRKTISWQELNGILHSAIIYLRGQSSQMDNKGIKVELNLEGQLPDVLADHQIFYLGVRELIRTATFAAGKKGRMSIKTFSGKDVVTLEITTHAAENSRRPGMLDSGLALTKYILNLLSKTQVEMSESNDGRSVVYTVQFKSIVSRLSAAQ